jgi:hypothetical protein
MAKVLGGEINESAAPALFYRMNTTPHEPVVCFLLRLRRRYLPHPLPRLLLILFQHVLIVPIVPLPLPPHLPRLLPTLHLHLAPLPLPPLYLAVFFSFFPHFKRIQTCTIFLDYTNFKKADFKKVNENYVY